MSRALSTQAPMRAKFTCTLCGHRGLLEVDVGFAGTCPACDQAIDPKALQGAAAQVVAALSGLMNQAQPEVRPELVHRVLDVLQAPAEAGRLTALASVLNLQTSAIDHGGRTS